MYEEEDRQFFDELYQLWSKTTGAKDTYWMPEQVEVSDEDARYNSLFGETRYVDIISVSEGDKRKWIGSFVSDEDADFIAGLHGAIPDLIRRLHEAIDEAVRKDEANDIAQGQLAEALLENQALREQIREWERDFEGGLN